MILSLLPDPFALATQLEAYMRSVPYKPEIGQGTQETKKENHLACLRCMQPGVFIRQVTIAKQTGAKANTTHVRMAALEQKGLVEKLRLSERRIMYKITEAGLRYLQTEDENNGS